MAYRNPGSESNSGLGRAGGVPYQPRILLQSEVNIGAGTCLHPDPLAQLLSSPQGVGSNFDMP